MISLNDAHSVVGPSKADRYLHCPGSVIASRGCPDKCSDAASLGTAAHLLGELTINAGAETPEDWKRPDMVDGKGKQYPVDKDMSAAVGVYTRYVKAQSIGCDVFTETRFHLPHIHEALFGTNDCLIVNPSMCLHVIDYKHGSGHIVEIVDEEYHDHLKFVNLDDTETVCYYPPIEYVNPQLLIYALGALTHLFDFFYSVKLTIVQPRAEHDHGPIRSVVLKPEDIRAWGLNTLRPAIEECFSDNPRYQIGSWCRFCPAIACPAVVKRSMELTTIKKNPITTPPAELQFPEPCDLTPEQLGNIHQFAQRFKTWADDVSTFMKEQLRLGKITSQALGYKRVQGRVSKKWKEGFKEILLAHDFVTDSDLYNPAPERSPAQLEKHLKEKGVAKSARDAIIKDAIEEVPGAPRLVPITAAGQELPCDAASAFESLTD